MALSQLARAVGALARRPNHSAVRCFAVAASSDSGAADAAAASPAYTITDAPGLAQQGGKPKWGRYVLRGIKGHTKKLNPLARQVAGLSVPEAMAQMAFTQPRRAVQIKTAIQRACWNADFYHNLPPSALMVDSAWTGKELSSPRIRHHSKGRAGMAHYRTSTFTVKLRAMSPAEADKLVKFPTLPTAETKAKLSPRGY